MGRYDLEEKEWELEHQRETEERLSFLRESHAIPTPIEIYAIWIELYDRQGGKIRVSDRNYSKTAHIDERNNTYYVDDEENTAIAYENLGWKNWCPTQDGGQIPANYGSSAMTLLILPEVTGQSLTSATDDWREGWEWGHTTVLSIVRDKQAQSGFRAETNKQYGIDSYKDVEELRKSMNLEQMLAKYNMRKGTKGISTDKQSFIAKEPELSLIKGKTVPEKNSIGKMLRWFSKA